MNHLMGKNLDRVIRNLNQPTLGICLGMQLLCKHSSENNAACLGVLDAKVQRFDSTIENRVPHMGWNSIYQVNGWLPAALQNAHVYFAHSYYVPVNEFTVATARHGIPFSAAIRKDNFFGVQFHPEKSAETGQQVLQSFLML
jgi:glutamine amidotransferase